MLVDLDVLVRDFSEAAASAEVPWPCPIALERLSAPHREPTLPPNSCAVYLFALSPEAGKRAPAGPSTVLKVGSVAATAGPRFSSQHYGRSAPSTGAKSLV